MLPKRLFLVLPLSVLSLATPGYAASEPSAPGVAAQACYAEAQGAVTSSSAYVYGNARQREQQLNGHQLYAARRLCYRLAEATAEADKPACADPTADAVDVYDDESAAHAGRFKGVCEQLSRQDMPVDGL